ncbi:unnamed protein product [Cochlearia groenlandica]
MSSVRDLQNLNNDDRLLVEGKIQEDDHTNPIPESNHHHHGLVITENSRDYSSSYHLHLRPNEDVSEHMTNNVSEETGLVGNKRRSSIFETEIVESSPPKRTKTSSSSSSSRAYIQVTPNYRLIPKEERTKRTVVLREHKGVLNNKCCLMKVSSFSGEGRKGPSQGQVRLAKCEDDMYEVDVWMGTMASAKEDAESVLNGDLVVEDLGAMFYKCISRLYDDIDMVGLVERDFQRVLPVILRRINQKLHELVVAKTGWEPTWKQVLKENLGKGKERAKVKGN